MARNCTYFRIRCSDFLFHMLIIVELRRKKICLEKFMIQTFGPRKMIFYSDQTLKELIEINVKNYDSVSLCLR